MREVAIVMAGKAEVNMTEPVYKWEPATDVYKEKSIQAADVEAELNQRLEELSIPKLRAPASPEDHAPFGVRLLPGTTLAGPAFAPSSFSFSSVFRSRRHLSGSRTIS